VILKLPYKALPTQHVGVGYSAILNVQIALPAKNSPRTKRFEAMIDSGATRCFFHSSIGQQIGLDIKRGRLEEIMGINGTGNRSYLHDIALYVPGGPVQITAAFSDELPLAGLLGMEGFFEYFRVTFDPTAKQCELKRLHII